MKLNRKNMWFAYGNLSNKCLASIYQKGHIWCQILNSFPSKWSSCLLPLLKFLTHHIIMMWFLSQLLTLYFCCFSPCFNFPNCYYGLPTTIKTTWTSKNPEICFLITSGTIYSSIHKSLALLHVCDPPPCN